MLTNGSPFFKLRDGTIVYKSDVIDVNYYGYIKHVRTVRHLYYFNDGIPCLLPVNDPDFDLFIFRHGGYSYD